MTTMEKQKSMHEVHISVDEVVRATRSDTLATRVRAADLDNDGTISVAEFLNMVSSELDAKSSAKRRLKVSIFLLVILVLSLAANAGLTYAVVDANKDTSVNNNMLVVKDGNGVVATAAAQATRNTPRESLLSLTPENATNVHSMAMQSETGSWLIFDVSRVEIINPNKLVTASSCDGLTIFANADSEELSYYDTMAEAQTAVAAVMAGEQVAEGTRRKLLKKGGKDKGIIIVDCTSGAC